MRTANNDRNNIALVERTVREILEAGGAQDVLAVDRYAHLIGGCRMAQTHLRSSCLGRSSNLFIADGSVMPTQGSAKANPH